MFLFLKCVNFIFVKNCQKNCQKIHQKIVKNLSKPVKKLSFFSNLERRRWYCKLLI